MGDSFQTIVDIDATADSAPDLAAAAVGWLVERGILLGTTTDCVLGAGSGHAPGPRYAGAVTETDPHLHTLRTNGLEVTTGRTIFRSSEADHITCPHCATTTRLTDGTGSPNDAWGSVLETIDTWYTGGAGAHPCPACGRTAGLNDWRWSPPWGFGFLGLTFWNWPPLTDDFAAAVAGVLGHRTARPAGKL